MAALHAIASSASQALAPNVIFLATQDTGSENAPSGKNQGPVSLVPLVEGDTGNLNALGDLNLQGLRWPVPLIETDGAWGSMWWPLQNSSP